MKSCLQQLDNNEAILLMYLADELSPQERAEVEQMLAADAGLRAEMKALRQTNELSVAAMELLDRTIPTPISPALASRQIVRLINLHKLQKKPAAPAAQGRRFPWWAYAMPSAAAAVLLFVLWTIYGPSSNVVPPPAAQQAHQLSANDKARLLAGSFELSDADDSANMSVVAVGNGVDDGEFLDPSHSSNSKAQ